MRRTYRTSFGHLWSVPRAPSLGKFRNILKAKIRRPFSIVLQSHPFFHHCAGPPVQAQSTPPFAQYERDENPTPLEATAKSPSRSDYHRQSSWRERHDWVTTLSYSGTDAYRLRTQTPKSRIRQSGIYRNLRKYYYSGGCIEWSLSGWREKPSIVAHNWQHQGRT